LFPAIPLGFRRSETVNPRPAEPGHPIPAWSTWITGRGLVEVSRAQTFHRGVAEGAGEAGQDPQASASPGLPGQLRHCGGSASTSIHT